MYIKHNSETTLSICFFSFVYTLFQNPPHIHIHTPTQDQQQQQQQQPMGCSTSSTGAPKSTEGRTAAERQTAWEGIRAHLPRASTPADEQRRVELFQQFDKSGRERLSYDEVLAGCRDVLHLEAFTAHLPDIVQRAFAKARELGPAATSEGRVDAVTFASFRLLLCYIYDYFELTVLFDEADTSGNMLIGREEWERAAPRIAAWGAAVGDAAATFRAIDTNGSGSITFDEFAAWAAAQKLEAEGDQDKA
ncbi:flagellar calcium-binding protein [Strigomonas culicis]|uniref:Flagellar calcium-binding protein n=1 Tax=Strigomonas culicis TaxID=28005 RepID=S9UDA0_9TRYP|nr:flagellar calcium-binding protein [Strigomonas culicis]|eukprot:EPY28797.1 flagellar calcium-binding protein [Strigomonas culicis]